MSFFVFGTLSRFRSLDLSLQLPNDLRMISSDLCRPVNITFKFVTNFDLALSDTKFGKGANIDVLKCETSFLKCETAFFKRETGFLKSETAFYEKKSNSKNII